MINHPHHETPSRGKIGVLLVDDEEPARSILRQQLSAHEDVEILGECVNGFEAVKRVAELGPDLLFLDIQMPKLDGFEVLELIGRQIAVIFVTTYGTELPVSRAGYTRLKPLL
jgi:two-component system LytT family response regulator